jgi:hypothetical protein
MNLFKEKELSNTVLEKFRRVEAGEFVEFTQEEAAFAGAFIEDAIGIEDVDDDDEEVRSYVH